MAERQSDELRPFVGLRSCAERCKVLLCDVFGTIHDSRGIFPAAVEALIQFRAGGGVVVLMSNAASPGAELEVSLSKRGLPSDCHDAIVTSADVARAVLIDCGATRVHHIGQEGERIAFERLDVRLCGLGCAELIVCTGYPDQGFDLDDLAVALRRKLDLICTNPDTEITVGRTVLRFAGVIANAYRASGGHVIVTGKPAAPIYEMALRRAAAVRGRQIDAEHVIAVGDSLNLDVRGALDFGLDAIWICNASPTQQPLPSAQPRIYKLPSLIW